MQLHVKLPAAEMHALCMKVEIGCLCSHCLVPASWDSVVIMAHDAARNTRQIVGEQGKLPVCTDFYKQLTDSDFERLCI